MLNELEEERSEQILKKMQPEEKEEVEELLEFREDSAGGLMDPGYVALPENATVADALESAGWQDAGQLRGVDTQGP